MAAAAAGMLAAPVPALGETVIRPSVQAEHVVSDNIGLTATGERTGHATAAGGGLFFRHDSRRLHVDIDYEAVRRTYWSEHDQDDFAQFLIGNSTVEILPRHLFLDAQAAIQEAIVNNREQFSATGVTDISNRLNVSTVNLAPSLRHRFGSVADGEVRYLFSATQTDTHGVADSVSNGGSVKLTSGKSFQTLPWEATAQILKSSRSNGLPDVDERRADLDLQYVFTSSFRLLAGIGYEKIKDLTLVDQPDGVTWKAGFEYGGDRRTTLSATFGRRYGEDALDANLSYKLGGRSKLTLSYEQQATNGHRLISDNLGFLSVDESGVLVDERSGLPFVVNNDAFSFESRTFRRDTLNLAFKAERRRNDFTLSGLVEARDNQAVEGREKVWSLAGEWERRLSRRLTSNLSATYRNTDFGTSDGRRDVLYVCQAGLRYDVYGNIRANLQYLFTKRDSNFDDSDLVENAVSVGVLASF